MRERRADIRRVIPWLGACLGGFYIWLFTLTYGIGASPDGVFYISVARSLLEGRGFVGFDGELFVHWPPLYPLVLTVPGIFDIDPQEGVRYAHMLLIGGTLYVALRWLVTYIRSDGWLMMLTIGLVVSKPIVYVGIRAMSEPLFGLLVLGFTSVLIAFSRHLTIQTLLLTGLVAALACLTRYIGVVCVIMGVAVIMTRPQRWRVRWRNMLVFGITSCLPVGLWLMRNMGQTGTLTGTRYASAQGLGANLGMLMEAIGLFFLPDEVPLAIRLLMVLGVLALVGWGIYQLYQQPEFQAEQVGELVWGLSLFCVSYIIVMLAVRTLWASDILNLRLLYPMFIPLWVLIGVVVDRHYLMRIRPQGLFRLAALLVAAWLLYPLAYTARIGYFSFTRGSAGFAYQEWRTSPLITALGEAPPDGVVYSNFAGAIYFQTQMLVRYSPEVYRNAPEQNMAILRAFAQHVSEQDTPVYLAWIDHPINEERYIARFASPEQMGGYLEVIPVAQYADGALYELRARLHRTPTQK